MDKYRAINTKIWSDTWFEELNTTNKLLFIYLITNEKNNMLGIYEISKKKISFETGIEIKTVEKALEAFERAKKIKYIDDYIILINFIHYQNYNTNMKKSAIMLYNDLPEKLKFENLQSIDTKWIEKGFETLTKAFERLRKIEREIEREIEIENEIENKKEKEKEKENKNCVCEKTEKISFEKFWEAYEKKGNKKTSEKRWNNLPAKTRELIMEHVPKYVQSTPVKRYRKNAESYLCQEVWNDEIMPLNQIKINANQQQQRKPEKWEEENIKYAREHPPEILHFNLNEDEEKEKNDIKTENI